MDFLCDGDLPILFFFFFYVNAELCQFTITASLLFHLNIRLFLELHFMPS